VIEEKRVVEKILRSIPSHLWQVAIVITTLLDVQILSVPNGQAPEEPPSSLQLEGKLYLTEDEWDACRVRREAENPGAGGPSGAGGSSKNGGSGSFGGRGGSRRGNDRWRGRGRGRGRRVAVVGHRRLMSVVVVESWATGLMTVGPRPRRIRPAPSKMRRPR
jgi:hypothetical protein